MAENNTLLSNVLGVDTFYPVLNPITGLICGQAYEEELQEMALLGMIKPDTTFAVFAQKTAGVVGVRVINAEAEADDFAADDYPTITHAFLGYVVAENESEALKSALRLGDALNEKHAEKLANKVYEISSYRSTFGHRWASVFDGIQTDSWGSDTRAADWIAYLGLTGCDSESMTRRDATQLMISNSLSPSDVLCAYVFVRSEQKRLYKLAIGEHGTVPFYLKPRLEEFKLLKKFVSLLLPVVR